MKAWEILKSVGSAVISNVVPGGSAIISLANEFLPDDKKLPGNATGDQALSAINSLPPEQQASVYEKELDVSIEQIRQTHGSLQAMLASEAISQHTTRPKIALGSFRVVSFAIIVAISAWAYGVVTGDAKMIDSVTDGWPFIAAVVAPLVTLLWAYFGVLKQEAKDKLTAASGSGEPPGIVGAIASVLGKK